MSLFYTAYFVKTEAPQSKLEESFHSLERVPDSDWITCDVGNDYIDGLFEPESEKYFTQEISAKFGESIFIGVDTANDQFEYEHSKDGTVLRKLSWIFDGCESTWMWVEGEPEAWEETTIFSEDNFQKTRDSIQYDERLNPLPEAELQEKEQDLRSLWDNREYQLDGKWPLGDATLGIAIQKYLGLKIPSLSL